MTSTRIATWLWDAHDALSRIERFTTGLSFSDFVVNEMLHSAVAREFTVVGEAFVRIKRVDDNVAVRVPSLPKAVAFRNILVHAYDSVDDEMVWQIIQEDVPQLKLEIDAVLATFK